MLEYHWFNDKASVQAGAKRSIPTGGLIQMKKRKVVAMIASVLAAVTLTGGYASANAEDTASVLKDGNVVTLKMMFPGANSHPADMIEIQDEMNKIIQQTVDAQLELMPVEPGAYYDQENLILSSGEKLDILFVLNQSQELANRGQLLPMTDLIKDYGKDVDAAMGDYIKACYVNNELYGLPTFHEYSQQGGLMCLADILDETGYTTDDIKSWDDVENVLTKVKELYPDVYPLVTPEAGKGCFEYYYLGTFDTFLTYGVGCYADDDPSDGVEIINMYSTPEYKEMAERAYDWNQKGFFLPDATTGTTQCYDYFRAGTGFGCISLIHPGTVSENSASSGQNIAVKALTPSVITTAKVNFAQYAIPTQCVSPEKAMAVLNLLYTNSDMQNLFRFGIEGKDYVFTDKENGIVGYPDGVDASNVGWTNGLWLSDNSAIAYTFETDEPDIYEQFNRFNTEGRMSPLYGFAYDSSNCRNELSAISNVVNKYKDLIETGASDPAESLDKFNKELDQAGMQNVIEDYQAQVDTWLSSQQ